ncbi:MAG: NAD(P)/FAD-dependent oxidoreductase, partial [Chloroflexota bacterium]
IIGAGFAGIKVAKQLARQPIDVLIIDRNNFHTFTPLLYQVATCSIKPKSVAYPIRDIFQHAPNVSFLRGTITDINTRNQQVLVSSPDTGMRYEKYDYLVVVAGSKVSHFNDHDIAEHTFSLRDLQDAIELRDHIVSLFEKAAWTDCDAKKDNILTFVVVGGGATGLETAGALHELYNEVLSKSYSNLENMKARVILLEAREDILGTFPQALRKSAHKQLTALGVEVRTNTRVRNVTPAGVVLEDGTMIDSHTVIWSTGVEGNPLAHMLQVPLSRDKRIPVRKTLAVKGVQNVFAAGDIAYLLQPNSTQAYPTIIPVAQQQAVTVAKNIEAEIQNQPMETFNYVDRGSMATIGRSKAVALVFNWLPLQGMPAWLAWLTLHLLVLMGMRNRFQVFLGWVWHYIKFDRSVKFIRHTHPDESDTKPAKRPRNIIDFTARRIFSR